jgi:hypothetical protein
MTHLQTTTGAHIKLSANGDFYPGAEDRVILCKLEIVSHGLLLFWSSRKSGSVVHGDRDSLSSALRQLVTRIAEVGSSHSGRSYHVQR